LVHARFQVKVGAWVIWLGLLWMVSLWGSPMVYGSATLMANLLETMTLGAVTGFQLLWGIPQEGPLVLGAMLELAVMLELYQIWSAHY
jgi:hypothetical protein